MRLNHGLRSLPLGLALGLAGLLQAAALAWPWPLGWTAGEPVAGLQVLSLAWLVLLLPGAPSARSAFLRGWLWATAWLAGTFWWLFVSMHTYGGLPAPLALLGVLALAAALGLYYAGAVALFWRWRDARLGWRLTAFVALWTLAELARGLLLTGFPWGAGGYAQVDALAPLAPWIGVYGMGAVAAVLALLAAQALALLARRAVPTARLVASAEAAAGPASSAARAAAVAGLLALVLLGWPGVARHWAASGCRSGPSQPASCRRCCCKAIFRRTRSSSPAAAAAGAGLVPAAVARGARAGAGQPGGRARDRHSPLPQQLPASWGQPLLQGVQQGRSALMLGLPMGSPEQGYTNSALSWRRVGTSRCATTSSTLCRLASSSRPASAGSPS